MKSGWLHVLKRGCALCLVAGCGLVNCATAKEISAPAPAPSAPATSFAPAIQSPLAVPSAPAAPLPPPVTASAAQDGAVVWYLPGPGRENALLKITSLLKGPVSKDEPALYALTIENVGTSLLDEVVASDLLTSGVKLENAAPAVKITPAYEAGCAPASAGSAIRAQWELGCLPPGAKKEITAMLVAGEAGTFSRCLDVTYRLKQCQTFSVIAPRLSVDQAMPAQTHIDKPVPVDITVLNDGTGPLRNITVSGLLPEGLADTATGSRQIQFQIDQLLPNQPRKYSLRVKAERTGVYTNRVSASSGRLAAGDSDAIVVNRPMVGVKTTGPAKITLGREATYDITVYNPGDVPLASVLVTDILPEGCAQVLASDNGTSANGSVTWTLANLAPGEQRILKNTVRSRKVGTVVNRVQASASECPVAKDEAATEVEGVAALMMEVSDNKDPLLIGESTVYTITVRNQGSAVGRNIVIQAFLEESQNFVSASGSSAPSRQGAETVFAPVDIAPGQSAVWTITARAGFAADARFKVMLTADGFDRPVGEMESTMMY